MQDFQGKGSDHLDTFFDHVKDLADFYCWDGRETCSQARVHLHGTALAYVERAPFQSRNWEELKALLLKHFQPRDLTATYKAQFWVRRRKLKDIYMFVVVDQFLLGMDNHELSVQVAAHGHRRTEDVLRLARSLEAVHEEEKHASRPGKPATQARFMNNVPSDTTDT